MEIVFNTQGPDIKLSKTENELIHYLLRFCEHLRNSKPELPPCECRIAGGWVRDKVSGADFRAHWSSIDII
jgi:tRNA nucleotidyltransferase/poly(A) polymerase